MGAYNPAGKYKLKGQYAGLVSRAAALLLDYLIVVALLNVLVGVVLLVFSLFSFDLRACTARSVYTSAGVTACVGGGVVVGLLVLLVGPLYYVLFWTLVGQTIGQRVMGLHVAGLDGRPLGFLRSLVRWLGYLLCFATLGIGFLWVLVDDRRMGWHDKLARTCVIYSWKAVHNQRLVDRLRRRLRRDGPGATTHET